MNTKSLNRAIGLAMSALQQARAANRHEAHILFLRVAISRLNKARAYLKRGDELTALFFAKWANENIQSAISWR